MDMQMTPDLTYLAWSAGLCIVLWIPYILARIKTWGLGAAVGYPQNPPEVPAWAKRSERAHLNLVENIGPFAALVLVAHVAGAANELTAIGAILFFWARFGQALMHILAVPGLRTLMFFASWVGMVIIFVQIIT